MYALQAYFRRVNEPSKVTGTCNYFMEFQRHMDIYLWTNCWSCFRCSPISNSSSSMPATLQSQQHFLSKYTSARATLGLWSNLNSAQMILNGKNC